MADKDLITIYHNPRCTKSRQTLELLQSHGFEPQIIEYLETPPTQDELRVILKKLDMKAEQLVRKGEPVYQEQFAGKSLDEQQWLDALVSHPILIERPIVIRGEKAIIGRPPERVRALS